MTQAMAMMRYDANKKSAVVAYLLWWFVGYFGAHRFYVGHTGSAIALLIITLVSLPLMLVAVGFFTIFVVAIWLIVDAFLIPGMVRDHNNALAAQLSTVLSQQPPVVHGQSPLSPY